MIVVATAVIAIVSFIYLAPKEAQKLLLILNEPHAFLTHDHINQTYSYTCGCIYISYLSQGSYIRACVRVVLYRVFVYVYVGGCGGGVGEGTQATALREGLHAAISPHTLSMRKEFRLVIGARILAPNYI